jgi:hypothetical protein
MHKGISLHVLKFPDTFRQTIYLAAFLVSDCPPKLMFYIWKMNIKPAAFS